MKSYISDIFQSHFCVVAKTVQMQKITETTGIKEEEQSKSHRITESLLVDFLLTMMINLLLALKYIFFMR